MLSVYSLLHVISAVIWVGGMAFAHSCLRPSAVLVLQPPERLTLWVAVFKRFFPFVWAAVILLPVTGYLLLFSIWGSMGDAPVYVHIMNGTGLIMILIYLHLFFSPFKMLKLAVAEQNWPEAGKSLSQIRLLVTINLLLGIIVICVASGGRLFI